MLLITAVLRLYGRAKFGIPKTHEGVKTEGHYCPRNCGRECSVQEEPEMNPTLELETCLFRYLCRAPVINRAS